MKTFLAVYIGRPNPDQSGEEFRQENPERVAEGMAAWGKWMTDHAADVVVAGGPLGKTKEASSKGLADIRNSLTGFTIVQAESHEAAAKMFLDHPHYTHFPGESVEVMEILPIPGA